MQMESHLSEISLTLDSVIFCSKFRKNMLQAINPEENNLK